MTRRAVLSLLGLGLVAFALYAVFAVRTSERVSKQEHDDREAHKRFMQDFERRGK
jgi:hypothetical protein